MIQWNITLSDLKLKVLLMKPTSLFAISTALVYWLLDIESYHPVVTGTEFISDFHVTDIAFFCCKNNIQDVIVFCWSFHALKKSVFLKVCVDICEFSDSPHLVTGVLKSPNIIYQFWQEIFPLVRRVYHQWLVSALKVNE